MKAAAGDSLQNARFVSKTPQMKLLSGLRAASIKATAKYPMMLKQGYMYGSHSTLMCVGIGHTTLGAWIPPWIHAGLTCPIGIFFTASILKYHPSLVCVRWWKDTRNTGLISWVPNQKFKTIDWPLAYVALSVTSMVYIDLKYNHVILSPSS
jgi:hypothetical protein